MACKYVFPGSTTKTNTTPASNSNAFQAKKGVQPKTGPIPKSTRMSTPGVDPHFK